MFLPLHDVFLIQNVSLVLSIFSYRRVIAAHADGVVVGSAIVELIAGAHAEGRDPAPDVSAFVRCLKDAITAKEPA